jgi:hypothetical protein
VIASGEFSLPPIKRPQRRDFTEAVLEVCAEEGLRTIHKIAISGIIPLKSGVRIWPRRITGAPTPDWPRPLIPIRWGFYWLGRGRRYRTVIPDPLYCSTITTSMGFTSACIASQQACVEWPALRMDLQSSPEVITMLAAPCSAALRNCDISSCAK